MIGPCELLRNQKINKEERREREREKKKKKRGGGYIQVSIFSCSREVAWVHTKISIPKYSNKLAPEETENKKQKRKQ